MLNGIQVEVGDNSKLKACYFSNDAGSTAKSIENITSGDEIIWNGVVAGFDLDTNDYFDINYNYFV
jgi:hypothetical protein